MKITAGTSGYSYKEWKGPFYPEDLPAKGMLSYYASQLPTVEINNTFYRMPKRTVIESWASQVPESFRFVIKASRRITHFKRLKDTEEELGFLLENTALLGPRLGALLFQLPPNLKLDLERFDRFLDALPAGTPAAFEFRHPDWADEPVYQRLRERGLAWVASDTDEDEGDAAWPETGALGYLRLRRAGYDRAALTRWARAVLEREGGPCFVYFKHEDAGAGPKLALEFSEIGARLAARKPAKASPGTRKKKAG